VKNGPFFAVLILSFLMMCGVVLFLAVGGWVARGAISESG